MRRTEFRVTNRPEAIAIMEKADVGYLGLMREDGWPRVAPVNFVFHNERIYFHGAAEGEKFDILKKSPKAAFSADVPFSLIPSHWRSASMACFASQMYKSVHIRGIGGVVEDIFEKAEALDKIMQKYQPEGKYDPIDPANPAYQGHLKMTATFRIVIEEMAVKVKFSQHLSAATREELARKLDERGLPIDLLTAKEIRKTL